LFFPKILSKYYTAWALNASILHLELHIQLYLFLLHKGNNHNNFYQAALRLSSRGCNQAQE